MEVQINLDALADRYVRSMETKVELYKARTWVIGVVCLWIGLVIGALFGASVVRRAVAESVTTEQSGSDHRER